MKDNRVSIAIRVKYRAFADDGSIGPETMGPRGREQLVKKKRRKQRKSCQSIKVTVARRVMAFVDEQFFMVPLGVSPVFITFTKGRVTRRIVAAINFTRHLITFTEPRFAKFDKTTKVC